MSEIKEEKKKKKNAIAATPPTLGLISTDIFRLNRSAGNSLILRPSLDPGVFSRR